MSLAEYRAENARQRAIDRFAALDASGRRTAIRVASEKRDFGLLQMLLEQPALLDGQTAKAIETDIARNSHPDAYQRYQELHGVVMDGSTEHDPLSGALSVTSYAIDATCEWMDKEIGNQPDMAERLAAQAAAKSGNNGGAEGA
jgi:hypothetical protein